ncbi:hypothetical protein KZ779_02820 [Escherichia coli]|nr:hypothetical protein [Escherichia coli]
MSELNQIVGVEVSVQDGGTYNITMTNGYSLVQGKYGAATGGSSFQR